MKKINIAERVVSLRENVIGNEKKDLKNPNEKFCPFVRDRICNSRCKLYRKNQNLGYECPFQEIPSMSWNVKNLIKKIIGGSDITK